MYYPSSENKGAGQLRGCREADLRLCFRLCRLLVFPWGGSFGDDKAPMSHNVFQIVEAMPQTKDVGNFMETLGSFYEIVDEDSPLDDDQMSRIPNHTGGGGSAGVTPDHSHSDTSSEHGRTLTVVHEETLMMSY